MRIYETTGEPIDSPVTADVDVVVESFFGVVAGDHPE